MINLGFWEKLEKPVIALAPMANVTDAAFRRVIATHGKPDVMWTEFVSADGLIRAPKEGREKLLLDFMYTEAERPIVAQIFGGNPDTIREASKLVATLGFDGLDINMGCPDRAIEKQCAGAALMKNPSLARAIVRAAREGLESAGSKIPISIKTRLGYNKNELLTWLPELLAEEPAVITLHARTRKEMSKVPARWEDVREAVDIRNRLKSKTLIFGNGDVATIADAFAKAEESGADGVMLGRAIFGNPFLFSNLEQIREKERPEQGEGQKRPEASEGQSFLNEISLSQKLRALVEHTRLFEKLFHGKKNFAIMKKHYKAYVQGFDGAAELRARLMEAKDADEVSRIVEAFTIK
ncbi:MAG: tRNA-dihydrouridine synthase [Candidatus Taylorbacteria bacterium]